MVMPNLEQTVTQHPYDYNFIRIKNPHIGFRKEKFAERLAAYMNKYHLTAKKFAELSHELAGKKGFRVTERDISNYLYRGISPKIDKLYAISQVMGVDLDYFCGYGASDRKSRNPIMEARYRKYNKKK